MISPARKPRGEESARRLRQLQRVVRIAAIIREKGPVTIPDLTRELLAFDIDVCERTTRRDCDALLELGFIATSRQRGTLVHYWFIGGNYWPLIWPSPQTGFQTEPPKLPAARRKRKTKIPSKPPQRRKALKAKRNEDRWYPKEPKPPRVQKEWTPTKKQLAEIEARKLQVQQEKRDRVLSGGIA